MSVNKAILVGRLGSNPDVKRFDNGDLMAVISVATGEKWTDKKTGDRRETTEWHRVVLNGKLAEIAEKWLRKGMQVYLEGKIATRKWTDNQGIERYSTDIRASQLVMLGSANDNSPEQSNQSYHQPMQAQGNQQAVYQPNVMPSPSTSMQRAVSDDMPF
ncbi:single-strand binding protein [Moraxella cuniculi DSM 21768]|uniref:Single-stranded DNA-binding protein n=1 Tax=Moraxella cuniculi DSM 21768 TaxID=1122245 RepID=A0A1N7DQ25_9GAMM|nr:single-stranded DNA-binding protein [Moraxella cuniculi]OOS05978.1 hypothetical protein B0189_05800 [Moraxella cuniculi]SIR77785.1 single-strand binding protein [Moraxella cuniculi DSM 21768]